MRNRTTATSNGPKSLRDRLRDYNQKAPMRMAELFTIFKVPLTLREVDKDAYEPKMVSIGPYHRGKKPALEYMEEHKLYYLQKFLNRYPSFSLDSHLSGLKESVSHDRNRYSEATDDLGPDQFAEMLLLDGCFVIEFMLQWRKGKYNEDMVIRTPLSLQLVVLDLLMLENQIPFSVLQKIYGSVHTPNPQLVDLALDFFKKWLHINNISPRARGQGEFLHLLDLLHSCIVPSPVPPQNHHIDMNHPGGHKKWVKLKNFHKKAERSRSEDGIECATKLAEVGITFREGKELASPLEVRFEKGVVEMARLEIYDDANVLYRNLIAFEHCHPSTGTFVTNYFVFVDCLVDKPSDVALLQRDGVLKNGLGSEEAAANLINQLCKNAVEGENGHLKEVMDGVNRHCRSRLAMWRAKLVRDYFGSPWSIMSLAAAATLLILTLIQTIFTVLSYVRPREGKDW